jgi:spermidine/putrescine transport system substrate-binding protein
VTEGGCIVSDDSTVELQLTRRALLAGGAKGAVALGAVGLLPAGAAFAAARAENPTAAEIASASGTVRGLVWQGYDDKKIYRGLTGVTLKPGYLTQNEDVLTKSRVGGRAQFDVMTIFQGYVDPLLEIGAIEPVDVRLLRNYGQLFPRFRTDRAFRRQGRQYSIPFLWGTMQVNYVAGQTPRPRTFADLMAPSLKGKIGLNDDTYSAITQFARFAGARNPNHLTKAQLQRTMKLLERFKPQVAGIAAGPEVTGFLLRREALVTLPDWTPSLINARKAGLDVRATMPALTFVDGWLVVNGAENKAAAYALVDRSLSREAQAVAGNTLGLGVVNRSAVPLLKKELRDSWPYDRVAALLRQAPAYPGVPVKSTQFATLQDWVEAWQKYKASF